jgi:hypothetical protein
LNRKIKKKTEFLIIYSEVRIDEGKSTVPNMQQCAASHTVVLIE